MKTYKQFQHNIQEIDQNLMGPGIGLASGLSNVGKAVVGGLSRMVAGSAGSSAIRKPKLKFKGPGGDPSGSGLGQAQRKSK
tara:strand:- start:213 stop:455 length:243 start_codon:yes stop_codon:yes gene_type:complete